MINFFTDKELEFGSNFIMLVGAPGSGKSTLADKIATNGQWVVISPDIIREELTGNRQDQSRNKEVFDIVYNRISDSLDWGKNVIYDATNCSFRYRMKVMNVVNDYATKTVCLVSKLGLLDCLRNNENRQYIVPEEIVERMYINLKNSQPSMTEGYDIIARF